MSDLTLRGVPTSILKDSWWLDAPVFRRPPADRGMPVGGSPGRGALRVILLVAAADVLIWQVNPGASLALFGVLVLVAAYLSRTQMGGADVAIALMTAPILLLAVINPGPVLSVILVTVTLSGAALAWITLRQARAPGLGGLLLGAVLMLPVMEDVQFLSVLFWLAGVLAGAAWICLGGWQGIAGTAGASLRLLLSGPGQVCGDLRDFRNGLPRIGGGGLRGLALGWSVPLGLGLIFASLLIEANPMLSRGFNWVDGIELPHTGRLLFWTGIAFLVWPFLRLAVMQERLRLPFAARGAWAAPAILNAASVRRSLVLFNLLFAVQTASDLAYLWGGAMLPDGMSYAEYAHRGAYPLLVTALLAGAFALMARPFVAQDRLLRTVLLVWVVQTVLLVLSSILRLELYVGVYGLTRLRLAAFVWMGVVAAGLTLVIWQVIAERSAHWLLVRAAALGFAVLYGCCFVSFDRAIATYNLSHDVPVDRWYICQLGPAALPAIHQYETRTRQRLCPSGQPWVSFPRDWREWGFRNQRTRTSLAEINKGTF